ncbi:uncharacterized protein LOC135262093 isoform X4 [Anguilla rostrata]|uniref:uncharacterized protein LOC135262093 isoform X4 n=1 Tax=Anguilla rostrata TaxID=7938 RepID=UPI0030CDE6B5
MPFEFNVEIQASHSLKYFYTGVTAGIDFPEYTSVGMVDDEQFTYYDSNMRRTIPKTEWIKENVGADYWDEMSQIGMGHQQSFKTNIGILMQRFNQTQGVHTVQRMYGCEWDDETEATGGFNQYGYDGEDFVTYDLKYLRYIAPVQQAFITAVKWSHNPAELEHMKQYLTQECVDWLKKYVSYGRSALERTVAPEVSLLQKDPCSPVITCHVTGFYPRGVMVTWQRNGKELDGDVELGETVPNEDGTFQTTSHLTVKPEDWKGQEYTCTVQHKSLKQDIILPVKEENIKRNSDIKTSHSLKYFYTAVTAGIDFPEFTALGLVDDEPFTYYDSKIRRPIPKTEWIKENEGADYWDRKSDEALVQQHTLKGILMQDLDQTQGVHTLQRMVGCEWDDVTGATRGFDQYGYDGEDFITYDLRNQRYIAVSQQAFITAVKWNNNPALLEHRKQYLTLECVAWLKKYVSYGRSALERTVAPEVSLLQKDPSSPVITCHVTGFYPRVVMVIWQRNGEDLDVDVEMGETVPNEDRTFQTRSHLRVKPEDWKSQEYTCTVQQKSLEQDIVVSVKEENIKRNSDIKTLCFNPDDSSPPMGIIIGCVVGALILILAVIGVVIWKKRSSSYKTTNREELEESYSKRIPHTHIQTHTHVQYTHTHTRTHTHKHTHTHTHSHTHTCFLIIIIYSWWQSGAPSEQF